MPKLVILILPVIFSTAAQLFVKLASQKDVKSYYWFFFIGSSLSAYLLAFVFYANTLKHFPISIASPVNTIAVMLLVIFGGVVFWGESIGSREIIGICLGILSLVVLCSPKI